MSNPRWSAGAAARMARRGGAAGSTGLRPITDTGSGSSSGKSRNRRAWLASLATCETCRIYASSRCPSSTCSPRGPSGRPGVSGSIAFPRSLLARSDDPSACCGCSPSCGQWPRWARSRSRRRATCCRIAWWRSTGSRRRAGTGDCLSAPRTRPAAAASASSSSPVSPSAWCRSGRARIRSCSMAAALRSTLPLSARTNGEAPSACC